MKIGITQLVVGDLTVDQLLELCRAAGYEAVELVFRPGKELHPEMSAAELAALRQKVEGAGVAISSVIAGLGVGNLLSRDPAQRDLRVKGLERAIVIGGALGASATLLHPGQLPADGTYEAAWMDCRDALRRLAPLAAKHHCVIAVENVWNRFLLSPREMRQFVDEIGSEWVAAYLDTANMMAYGYPEQWVRELGRRVCRVHLKDFRRREHRFVPLTEGDTDWPLLMNELRAVGYTQPLIHEVDGPRELLLEMAARMRKIVGRG